MKHIVLDMEWNPTLGRRALNQEIIQMAALKYDASWNYEDAFETFIKPDFTPLCFGVLVYLLSMPSVMVNRLTHGQYLSLTENAIKWI